MNYYYVDQKFNLYARVFKGQDSSDFLHVAGNSGKNMNVPNSEISSKLRPIKDWEAEEIIHGYFQIHLVTERAWSSKGGDC
jgi:hypothetical protein